MVRHGSKRIWRSYFYSGKRGSSDCLRDDSVPMACHFFISHERVAPASRACREKHQRDSPTQRYCGHHDTILISNILTSCSIMGRRVVTHEKIESLVLRKGLRAVRIIWLAWARPLSLQLFCLSPPCFNYSLIWLQAEMKDNCPFDDGARYKNKWECFSRTRTATPPLLSRRLVILKRNADGERAHTHHIKTAHHTERIPWVAVTLGHISHDPAHGSSAGWILSTASFSPCGHVLMYATQVYKKAGVVEF